MPEAYSFLKFTLIHFFPYANVEVYYMYKEDLSLVSVAGNYNNSAQ